MSNPIDPLGMGKLLSPDRTVVDHFETLKGLVGRLFSERSVHVYNGEISLTECSVSLTGAELLVLEQLYPEDVS